MILSQRLGRTEASWDGVRTFQTILFCMSVVLLALLIWKAFTVLPWYIKCLWHMTPITRGISIVARAVNKPAQDKATVLDHAFRRVVTTYSARSGRSELDVYAEVDEHGEGSYGVLHGVHVPYRASSVTQDPIPRGSTEQSNSNS